MACTVKYVSCIEYRTCHEHVLLLFSGLSLYSQILLFNFVVVGTGDRSNLDPLIPTYTITTKPLLYKENSIKNP